MILTYFKTAWRNLVRSKGYAPLNIAGLTIAIACSILLLGYTSFELGYDRFVKTENDIYRVDLSMYQDRKLLLSSAENFPGLAPAMTKTIPEVLRTARLYNLGYKNNCLFTANNKSFNEKKFFYADASFLQLFQVPLRPGNPATALVQPHTAVLSASCARKYFGDQNPVGQTIRMNDDDRHDVLCQITGVFPDWPAGSHLSADILFSYASLSADPKDNGYFEQSWNRKDFYTYALLKPGTDTAMVNRKMAALVSRFKPRTADGQESVLYLQPLSALHFSSGLIDEPSVTASKKSLYFLMMISYVVLLIAWVNYINITTAGSFKRAREMGVRQLLGSRRGHLTAQLLCESVLVTGISTLLAISLVVLLQPELTKIFQADFDFSQLFSTPVGYTLVASLIAGVLSAGIYPAFVLSRYQLTTILKGKIAAEPGGQRIRRALVVAQYALSIFLILGTVVVYRQVQFMLRGDLGMNINNVLVLARPGKWDSARSAHNGYVNKFRELMTQSGQIASIGMSDELPGKEIRNPSSYQPAGRSSWPPQSINSILVDDQFLSTLEFRLLAGRQFSRQIKSDEGGLILTNAALPLLGYAQPRDAIGQQLLSDGKYYPIIGVVAEYHQMTLEQKAEPIAFQFNNSDAREFEYYLVRPKKNQTMSSLPIIKKAWDESFQNNPFVFTFLDDFFNRQYRSVEQFEVLFASFAGIAIGIACIGLFSLLAFLIQQRFKELGVRKVLGASGRQLMVLLGKDFIRLILIANCFAWPVGWWVMSRWLTDFAYRVSLRPAYFLLAGSVALMISLATIGWQSFRAARVSPIKSLRTE